MSYQFRSDYLDIERSNLAFPALPSLGGVYRRRLKRALDLLLVLAASIPVLLVIGALALIVRRDGHGAFYSQDRVGMNGAHFRLWKLRTMVPDADAALAAHLAADPEAAAEWLVHQKLKNDPRITRFGRILRATSLDELPQLWNVARGDMAIVGPRPMMPCQQALYPGCEYYRMRPGITGFWQISERSESSFADRARFDRDYYRHISFATDLRTIARTVGVVLRRTGV